jgi:membrane protein DedA with SNARE-associated domain
MALHIPRTKLGGLLIGIYFLLLLVVMEEYLTGPPKSMDEFGMFIFTLPSSLLIFGLVIAAGIESFDHNFAFYVTFLASWVCNSSILYLLGALVAKIAEKIGSGKSQPPDFD